MNPNPQTFVACARTFQGVPFRHGGRDRAGIDCGGLISLALEEAGGERLASLEALGSFSRDDVPTHAPACLRAECAPVPLGEVVPGDLLAFVWPAPFGSGVPEHIAIVTSVEGEGDERRVVILHNHFLMGNRRVVEHAMDEGWWERLHSAWRLKVFA